jgi:MFS superfamily sulfate permease-like transporter
MQISDEDRGWVGCLCMAVLAGIVVIIMGWLMAGAMNWLVK